MVPLLHKSLWAVHDASHLQEPCVPATHTFYKLLADYTNIHIADAAAELATPRDICRIATPAGFSTVEVPSHNPKVHLQLNWLDWPSKYCNLDKHSSSDYR